MAPEVDPNTTIFGVPPEGDTAPQSSRFAQLVRETHQAHNSDAGKPGSEHAGHPSVLAKSRRIDATPPSVAVAGVAASPAFGKAVFAPLMSDPPPLAGLTDSVRPRTAGAAAGGYVTGMFAFMPHSPTPQTGTIPGQNLSYTYSRDAATLVLRQRGTDGQPGEVLATLHRGLDGMFRANTGRTAAARSVDGGLEFDGNYLHSLSKSPPVSSSIPPELPLNEIYPVDPNAGKPVIEIFPVDPEAGRPLVETFPVDPDAGKPTIEIFPVDPEAGRPLVETFPVSDDDKGPHIDAATATPNDEGGYDVEFKYRPDWTPEQRAAADEKVAALNDEAPVARAPSGPRTNAAAEIFRSGGGVVPQGSDVDHTKDRQLGGADELDNLNPLDSSVNRSLGSQLGQILRAHPDARIDHFSIGD